jgi:hypothetical protein
MGSGGLVKFVMALRELMKYTAFTFFILTFSAPVLGRHDLSLCFHRPTPLSWD